MNPLSFGALRRVILWSRRSSVEMASTVILAYVACEISLAQKAELEWLLEVMA